ncbi:hypothetical protein BN1095_5700001 [Clostridioides difficile]|uniref:Uncharacterized protein n=1 Tax=Clostridioides difficile TaxID=1496 RepID=A0A069ASM4_CLODI|nr:hypothetical protein BN1095_5700001 [Clostridioides difficile]
METPFVIIRAVSDSADEKADISFDEFLKTAAANSAKNGGRNRQIFIKPLSNHAKTAVFR